MATDSFLSPDHDTLMCDLGSPARTAEHFLPMRVFSSEWALQGEEGIPSEPRVQAGCMLLYLSRLWEHTQASWMLHKAHQLTLALTSWSVGLAI